MPLTQTPFGIADSCWQTARRSFVFAVLLARPLVDPTSRWRMCRHDDLRYEASTLAADRHMPVVRGLALLVRSPALAA